MGFKTLMFKLYGVCFNAGARLGVKDKRIALVSMHNANFTDSLYEIESLAKGYEILKVSRNSLSSPKTALKFCTVDAFRTGRAHYIFLNDNFMAMGYTSPSPKTEIVQLWHGQGAFKKFGFHIPQPEEIRERERALSERVTRVVCSADGVADIYAEAFGVPRSKVLTTGTPNEDFYFRVTDGYKRELREKFDAKYPNCKGKQLILYAPTFRENVERDGEILSQIDFSALCTDDTEVLVRLHPQVRSAVRGKSGEYVDVTDYDNVNELCVLADVLITDYSSICMDFSLQRKPMVFFAYDLESYISDRNFYFDYESYVPGPVAHNMEELKTIFESGNFELEKNEKFRIQNFGNPDGTATQQLLKTLGIEYKGE